jgi:phospholipid/cholesterol/gamma-HCH transport system substrate-binding protein
MGYRSSEVKAGLFIFVSMIGLVIMIFMVGNIQDYFKPRKTLKIVFNFTGGMEVGAPVRYAGLDIGSVKDIELLGSNHAKGSDRVTVIAEINPAIIIKKNSVAMIITAGLMGGLYIDIRPGTKGSPELAQNEQLTRQDSFEIAKIGDMATEVILEIRRFTKLTEELVADVRTTLEGVRTSVSHIDTIVTENRPAIRANMNNALKVSGKLSNFLFMMFCSKCRTRVGDLCKK